MMKSENSGTANSFREHALAAVTIAYSLGVGVSAPYLMYGAAQRSNSFVTWLLIDCPVASVKALAWPVAAPMEYRRRARDPLGIFSK